MAEAGILTNLLGTTATVTTIGQFLSGMLTVQKVQRQGTAGDISPFPFLMGTVGCALWLVYGQLKDDNMIIYCNIIGTLLNALYVLIFLRYVTHKGDLLRQIIMSCIIMTVTLAFAVLNVSQADAVENLGRVCILITLICCGSPLIALKHVIKTKSTETLPFPLILSMFLVCSQWWMYGILTADVYMQIPNLLGTLLALVQLALFAVYPSGPSSPSRPPSSAEHKYDLLKS
ncbi:Sugar transporter SWEET1 [Orchesella cincta]|uniref:Sugar transporter SWEET n=1 Tax=Orchesella cincta TaxID=48709 RepID=A0A1D2MYT0_ORCCI|nr:Sugar transporter SWEET1 [Orchesella cincta]